MSADSKDRLTGYFRDEVGEFSLLLSKIILPLQNYHSEKPQIDTEDPMNAQLLFEVEEEKQAKAKSVENVANDKIVPTSQDLKNDAFSKKVSEAKRGQEVLKYKKLDLPITEAIHNTVMSIPMSPVLPHTYAQKIVELINAY